MTCETLEAELAENSGSGKVGFIQSEIGALGSTVENRLKDEPYQTNYDTNINYVNALKLRQSVNHFTQNGAKIKRIPDRLFIGGAIDNDGAYPNVAKDWLSTFQNSLEYVTVMGVAGSGNITLNSPIVTFAAGGTAPMVGKRIYGVGIPQNTTIISVNSATNLTMSANAKATLTAQNIFTDSAQYLNGSGVSAMTFGLNGKSDSSAITALFGAQSKNFTNPYTSTIGIFGYALNNNQTYSTGAWAGYFEAQENSGATSSTHGIEIDVSSSVFELKGNPFQQSLTSALQLGAGCGVSQNYAGGTQNNIGTAIQIIDNPMKFRAGIVFGANSIEGTDGVSGGGATAISFACGHALEWYNKDKALVGRFMTTNTIAARQMEVRISDFGIQFLQGNSQAAVIPYVLNAVNGVQLLPSIANAPPQVNAVGASPNLDLVLSGKGLGLVSFGTHVAAATAVNGYIAIKDSQGNIRKLATLA